LICIPEIEPFEFRKQKVRFLLLKGFSIRKMVYGNMKILILASFAESLINFRGPLLTCLVREGHQVVACAPSGNPEVIAKISQLGVEFQDIPLQRTGMNPIKDICYLWCLCQILRKFSPDIVLSYTIKPVIFGSLACRLAGVPKSFSMITGLGTSFQNQTLKGKLLNHLVRKLLRLSLSKNKAIFFQNPDDRELFKKLNLIGKNTKAILINGSGVDLNFYTVAPAVKEPLVFLLIARLIKEKGIFEYAEVARRIKQRYKDVQFRLVGGFDEHPSAIQEGQVKQWQRDGVVEYCGHTKDVRPFIAAASVFVLPSFYREGTPRSVLEAMAMGRAIITTDAPGCRETVVEGKNGFLVPIKNVESLAKAVERFILQPDIVESMGGYSLKLAKEKYDVNKVNAVIMETIGLHHEKNI
jgi:glycosyltransferase involved in cell wall biosynthesis